MSKELEKDSVNIKVPESMIKSTVDLMIAVKKSTLPLGTSGKGKSLKLYSKTEDSEE